MEKDCQCVIGMLHDYENTQLITLQDLIEHIENERRYIERNKQMGVTFPNYRLRELADYCDFRKSTDVTRFRFCPFCGNEIKWRKFKNELPPNIRPKSGM